MSTPSRADRAFLRRCVLAATLRGGASPDQLDPDLDEDGVHLPGCAPLGWDLVAAAAGPAPAVPTAPGVPVPGVRPELDPPEAPARARVRDLLLAHLALHRSRVRRVPLAVPVGADRHPGAGWCARRVLGGALDLGAGVLVDDGGRERAVPVPRASARAVRAAEALGTADEDRLAEVGGLLVQRLERDAGTRGGDVLRPVGGCDVPTLLAAAVVRAHLVGDGGVLRAVAVPHRDRGWSDLARVDPAYVVAAWSATDLAERGFARPVLVTRDEVAPAPAPAGRR